MKKITVETVTETVKERISKYEEQLKIYTIVRVYLEKNLIKYEGKKMTKRIETALKKCELSILENYTFYLSTEYGRFTLVFWKGNLSNQVRIHLNYNDSVFLMDKFMESNKCYALNKDRLNVLRSQLNDGWIESNVNKINAVVDQYEALKDNTSDEMRYILFPSKSN